MDASHRPPAETIHAQGDWTRATACGASGLGTTVTGDSSLINCPDCIQAERDEEARLEARSTWSKAKDDPEAGELWSWYPGGYERNPVAHLSVWLSPCSWGLALTRDSDDWSPGWDVRDPVWQRRVGWLLQAGPLSVTFDRTWSKPRAVPDAVRRLGFDLPA